MRPTTYGSHRITRRTFGYGTGVAAAATMVSGCGLFATSPDKGGGKGSGRQGGGAPQRQAPALAAKVKQGSLPPLKRRLPQKPLVVDPKAVDPANRVGSYGGDWTTVLFGTADSSWLLRTVGYDRIVHWDPPWNKIVPNVAESFDVAPDGTSYTFTLRRGLKWSDGKPLTADDILFWYEDIFSNHDLTPVPAVYLTAGGKPLTVKKVDEVTVTFAYPEPNGLLLQWLATYDHAFQLTPRHYLEQFHLKYNKDANEHAKAEGLSDWTQLFLNKLDLWANPDLPRVHAWVPRNALGEGRRLVFERNPYYFKVDTEGNQLPYLDRVVYDIIEDEQTIVLKAAQGAFNMDTRHGVEPANKPVLARSRERGGYHFIDLKLSDLNVMCVGLNLTHPDPVKREIFQNKNFRIGLSYAMDREEIRQAVYQGQGRPWQAAPRPEAPYFDDGGEMGTQYTEHDPDRANEYLDRAGYSARNSDGIRLGPDGRPITFAVLTQTRYPEMIDTLQLIQKYWKDVGIQMQPKNIDGTLWSTTVEANKHDAAVDIGQIGYKDAILDPRWFFPAFSAGALYAPLWYNWYVGADADKEKPPAAMVRQMDLYREQLQRQTDQDARYQVMAQIVDIAKEEFWVMGILLPPEGYGIVGNDFHNVPKSMWESFRYPTPGPTVPAQYYVESS